MILFVSLPLKSCLTAEYDKCAFPRHSREKGKHVRKLCLQREGSHQQGISIKNFRHTENEEQVIDQVEEPFHGQIAGELKQNLVVGRHFLRIW